MKNPKISVKTSENSQKILEKTLWVLEKAKEYIQKNHNEFICNALDSIIRDYELHEEIEHKISEEIKIWINIVLDGNTYGTWLEINYPDEYFNRKEGRIKWLNYIIQEVKVGEYVFYTNKPNNFN